MDVRDYNLGTFREIPSVGFWTYYGQTFRYVFREELPRIRPLSFNPSQAGDTGAHIESRWRKCQAANLLGRTPRHGQNSAPTKLRGPICRAGRADRIPPHVRPLLEP